MRTLPHSSAISTNSVDRVNCTVLTNIFARTGQIRQPPISILFLFPTWRQMNIDISSPNPMSAWEGEKGARVCRGHGPEHPCPPKNLGDHGVEQQALSRTNRVCSDQRRLCHQTGKFSAPARYIQLASPPQKLRQASCPLRPLRPHCRWMQPAEARHHILCKVRIA